MKKCSRSPQDIAKLPEPTYYILRKRRFIVFLPGGRSQAESTGFGFILTAWFQRFCLCLINGAHGTSMDEVRSFERCVKARIETMHRRNLAALAVGGILALAALAALFPARRQVVLAANPGIRAAEPVGEEDFVDEARPPLRHYADSVRRNLFSSEPAAPKVTPAPAPAAPVSPTPKPREVSSPDLLGGFVYSGMARLGPALMALIEDPRTGRGRFVKVGDGFDGGRVVSINADRVTLRIQGRVARLARNQNYSLTPLNRSADILTAKPATPAPAASPASAIQPNPAAQPQPAGSPAAPAPAVQPAQPQQASPAPQAPAGDSPPNSAPSPPAPGS